MGKHDYNFAGGQYLTKIASSWFVSYMYHLKIDKKHISWQNVSNSTDRIKKYNKHVRYHIQWLQEIVKMSPKKLSTNKIGLNGTKVIEMAEKLLNLFSSGGVAPIVSRATFNIHVTYDESIKLKELSGLLNNINMSVNDYYRDNGVGSRELSQYSPVVNNVKNGSIWLEIIIAVFSGITVELLAEFILKRIGKDEKGASNNFDNIHIETGDNCTVHIHINSSNH